MSKRRNSAIAAATIALALPLLAAAPAEAYSAMRYGYVTCNSTRHAMVQSTTSWWWGMSSVGMTIDGKSGLWYTSGYHRITASTSEGSWSIMVADFGTLESGGGGCAA